MRLHTALLFLCLSASACAPNLCQRKEHFFKSCGGQLTYSDPMCERNLDRCTGDERAQIEGYVACLEKLGMCSAEGVAACGSQYPAGRNKFCPDR